MKKPHHYVELITTDKGKARMVGCIYRWRLVSRGCSWTKNVDVMSEPFAMATFLGTSQRLRRMRISRTRMFEY